MNDVDCPLATVLARRLRDARDELTSRWLERISARVAIDANQIFPSTDLLDHVPLLIDGMADYMEDPADEISADVPVVAKAMELGELRLSQGFSAHQILKEYEILGGVLFAFLVRIVDHLEEDCTRSELLACGQRLFRGISVVQQVTATHYLRISDERMSERENRLRSFNRMVTHELRNRIAAVSGASSMLLEQWVEEDEEQRRHFIGIVARNVDEMQKVLRDLLSLSRMEGSARHQRHVLLPEAIAEAMRQLREMAQEHRVELRVVDGIPPVEVDAGTLELGLVNYISNGIKYADPEKPERWVEVRAKLTNDEPARQIEIAVRDNGLGVAPEAREQLFERFYRVESAPEVEGTGLGLSIVRETMEAIGGRAWAEFEDGGDGGSTFKISLPARRAGDRAEA